jgi:hypothetical protein
LKFNTSVNSMIRTLAINGVSRKNFALESESMEPMLRAAVFKHFDSQICGMKYVVDQVRKNLGSKAAFDKLKGILKTASWKEVKSYAE